MPQPERREALPDHPVPAGLAAPEAWRLRLEPSLQLSLVGAPSIPLALRVPERPDVHVTMKEAIGAAVQHQELHVAVGEVWIEVLFDLRGPHDDRPRVEVFHPEGVEQVEPCLVNAYFNVAGTGPRDTTTPDAPAGD